MARWLIQRTARGNNGTEVFYDNLVTGARYPLGKLSSDVPDDMIVEWIYNHGKPAGGDKILLSDGTSLRVVSRGGRCLSIMDGLAAA